MPRPQRPWFRAYVEMFGDRKIRRLTPTQRWVFAAMMGAARESPVAGKLFVAEDLPMTHTELASYADVKEREIGPAVALMIQLKMVHLEGEVMVVTNFPRRQYESDTSTPRTQKHRSNRPDGNDVGTVKPGSQEQPTNGGRNAPETETDNRTRSSSVGTSGGSSVPREPQQDPPPDTCPDHPGGTTAPCGPCGRAKRARADWDTGQARRRSEAASAAAHERVRLRQVEVDACRLCDGHGYRLLTGETGEGSGGPCDHVQREPGAKDRAFAAITTSGKREPA